MTCRIYAFPDRALDVAAAREVLRCENATDDQIHRARRRDAETASYVRSAGWATVAAAILAVAVIAAFEWALAAYVAGGL